MTDPSHRLEGLTDPIHAARINEMKVGRRVADPARVAFSVDNVDSLPITLFEKPSHDRDVSDRP